MRPTLSFLVALAVYAGCTVADEATTDKPAQTPLQVMSNSNANFSNDLFKKFAKVKKGENLISSPLSAHIALSLLYQGAAGETAKQIAKSLYLPEDVQVSRQGAKQLMDKLNNVENVTLSVANQLYVSDKFPMENDYKTLASESFSAEASTLDFSQSEKSAKDINDWVDEKTNHKIKTIVKASDITPDTIMVLLNAIYFKGEWATAFKKESTVKRPFRLDEKNNITVDTMFNEGDYFYGELPELKAKFVELPYKNKDLSMIIVVPDEVNGLDSIIEKMELVNPANLRQKGYPTKVRLFLPKFKIESEIDLKEPLVELGMKDMFEDSANFTGITKQPVKIGKAVQKAFIEINEEGSEAAAVTGFKIMLMSAAIPRRVKQLHVDRPFLFHIFERQSKVELFKGIVKNL